MVKTVIVKLGTNSIKKIVEVKLGTCNIEDLNVSEEIHCWKRISDVKNATHNSKKKTVRLQYTRPDWAPAGARDIPRIIYEETIDGWEFSGMTSEANIRKMKFIKPD